jgi:hypothetical protein
VIRRVRAYRHPIEARSARAEREDHDELALVAPCPDAGHLAAVPEEFRKQLLDGTAARREQLIVGRARRNRCRHVRQRDVRFGNAAARRHEARELVARNASLRKHEKACLLGQAVHRLRRPEKALAARGGLGKQTFPRTARGVRHVVRRLGGNVFQIPYVHVLLSRVGHACGGGPLSDARDLGRGGKSRVLRAATATHDESRNDGEDELGSPENERLHGEVPRRLG